MLLANRAVSNGTATDRRSFFSGGPPDRVAPARTGVHAASTGVHADSTGAHAELHGVHACCGDGIGVTVTASATATLGRQPRRRLLLLWPRVLSEAGRRLEDTEAPWEAFDK